ncbi:MAG: hypothetical protein WBA74_12455, partial [Cyclobacteriaceae bacterium]
VYAYLPEQTALFVDNIVIDKAVFFYASLILFFLINFLFSALGFLYNRAKEPNAKKQSIRDWLLSLPVAINFYMIFIIAYIGVINNGNAFDPGTYGYLLYLGPLLLVVWIVAFAKILLTPAAEA